MGPVITKKRQKTKFCSKFQQKFDYTNKISFLKATKTKSKKKNSTHGHSLCLRVIRVQHGHRLIFQQAKMFKEPNIAAWLHNLRKIWIWHENFEHNQCAECVEWQKNFGCGFARISPFQFQISHQSGLQLLRECALHQVVVGHSDWRF